MKKSENLALFLDCPEKQIIITSLFFCILSFFTLPFLLLLTSIGTQDPATLVWFELVYHLINFIIVVSLFKTYLQDAMFLFGSQMKESLMVVRNAVIAIAVVIGLWYLLAKFTALPFFTIALYGSLPLSEMDVFLLSVDIVYLNPIPGLIGMVVLSPVICACLYYSVAFVPAYNVRPWLGYLVVALLLAFPRLCNALTYWDPTTEMMLYFAQLPIHLIACWSYKKTDSVCTPILVLASANLLAGIRILVLLLIGQ